MPKVSIIVPVYNVEDYLCECVDSLTNQTYADIEIILVDDGSTDKSGKICDEYASKDLRVHVLHKKNGGQSSARNCGLETASGEYVLFVDSDDYITHDAIEKLISSAEKYSADIVQADLLNDADKMKNPSFRKLPCENTLVSTAQFLNDKILTQTYDIVPFLYFIRKDYIKGNLDFCEGYFYEDQLWTMQLLTGDAKIVKIRFPFYYYRMNRPGSTTNHMYLKKGTDAAYICNRMAENIASRPSNPNLNAVMLISAFQFLNVWKRLSPADRKTAYNSIDKRVFDIALECSSAYGELRKELSAFCRNRKLYAWKYDIKQRLRKLMRR